MSQSVVRSKSQLAGYGQVNVAAAGTRVQLTDVETNVVEIKALKTNSGKIYIGDSGVTSNNGFILMAQESVQLPVDASKIYLNSEVNGEGVSWVGWL